MQWNRCLSTVPLVKSASTSQKKLSAVHPFYTGPVQVVHRTQPRCKDTQKCNLFVAILSVTGLDEAMATVTVEESIPLVDLSKYVSTGDDELASEKVAHSLEYYGAVIIKDPRVSEDDSNTFVDMMERYFAQPREKKMEDSRPELFYQVCTEFCGPFYRAVRPAMLKYRHTQGH